MDNLRDKITPAELREWFGSEMPIEAVNLLFNCPGDWTIGKVRDETRKLAERIRALKENTGPVNKQIAAEEAARLAEHGCRCLTCYAIFDGTQGHPENDCVRPECFDLEPELLGNAIRSLPGL